MIQILPPFPSPSLVLSLVHLPMFALFFLRCFSGIKWKKVRRDQLVAKYDLSGMLLRYFFFFSSPFLCVCLWLSMDSTCSNFPFLDDYLPVKFLCFIFHTKYVGA